MENFIKTPYYGLISCIGGFEKVLKPLSYVMLNLFQHLLVTSLKLHVAVLYDIL